MPSRDHRTRKDSFRKSYSRFFREIPWLTIICPSHSNLDSAVSCWLSSRFLRDRKQGHTIRTSKAEGLVSVYEDPYWTQIVLGVGNGEFSPTKDKLSSEIVLENIVKLNNQSHFNGGALIEVVSQTDNNEVLDNILTGTRINISRVEVNDELCAQKTLIKFGYILDALYQALSEPVK